MKKIRLEFCECEHQGDLDNYIDDLPKGTIVINKSINPDEETGIVTIEVENPTLFWAEFGKTDSYGFLN